MEHDPVNDIDQNMEELPYLVLAAVAISAPEAAAAKSVKKRKAPGASLEKSAKMRAARTPDVRAK